MSVEILGMITATPSSEVDQPLGEAVDAGFVRRFVLRKAPMQMFFL